MVNQLRRVLWAMTEQRTSDRRQISDPNGGGAVADSTHRANGRLRSTEHERELIRLALNDANSFAFWAPHEREWWPVFCESLVRHWDEADATGQRSLADFYGGDRHVA